MRAAPAASDQICQLVIAAVAEKKFAGRERRQQSIYWPHQVYCPWQWEALSSFIYILVAKISTARRTLYLGAKDRQGDGVVWFSSERVGRTDDVGMGQMHNSAITVRFLIRARRGRSHV